MTDMTTDLTEIDTSEYTAIISRHGESFKIEIRMAHTNELVFLRTFRSSTFKDAVLEVERELDRLICGDDS